MDTNPPPAAGLLEAAEHAAAQNAAAAVSVAEERAKADAILDAARRMGLIAGPVPPALGGPGFPLLALARALAALSASSGSAGLILAMHLAQVLTLVRHAPAPVFTAFLSGDIAGNGGLVASGTSERGVGGDILTSVCATEPQPGGALRLAKHCGNISYLDRAAAILATANHHDGRRSAQRLILLDRAAFTFTIDRETLLLGMRGIVNRAGTIEARFTPDAILPEPFRVIARTMSAASHLFWASVWSGIAAGALTRARAAAGATATERLSAASDRLYAMNALIRDAAAALDAAADASAFRDAVRFNSLKITCADLLMEIVTDCAAAAGFKGYIEGTPSSLSEAIRDAFSARIMVSNDRLAAASDAVRGFVRERI